MILSVLNRLWQRGQKNDYNKVSLSEISFRHNAH